MPTGEALEALLKELRRRYPPDTDPREVELWLASLGYDARQIELVRAALTAEVASDAPDPEDAAERPAPVAAPIGAAGASSWPSIRIAAPYERARFAAEAWGHLLELRAGGLDGVEFEQLVDRALLQVDGRIGIDELRLLLDQSPPGDDPAAGSGGTVH